jgi:hypothetical protein
LNSLPRDNSTGVTKVDAGVAFSQVRVGFALTAPFNGSSSGEHRLLPLGGICLPVPPTVIDTPISVIVIYLIEPHRLGMTIAEIHTYQTAVAFPRNGTTPPDVNTVLKMHTIPLETVLKVPS